MSSSSQLIREVLERASEPLARSEIFALANLYEDERTLSIFEFMKEKGKIERIGVGRGAKYQLVKPVEPVVTRKTRPKVEIPDYTKEILAFAAGHPLFTFKDLTDIFSEDVYAHHVRLSLNSLIEGEKLFALGEKRDRKYSTQPDMVDIVEIADEDAKFTPIVEQIWPFLLERKKGIVTSEIIEKFPDLSRSLLYMTLNYLIDSGKLEAFGERRGRTYSIAGEGEIDRENLRQTEVNALKPRVLAVLQDLQAARPLVIQQKLLVDRALLNAALEDLVREDKVYESGERRGKIVALKGVKLDAVEQARETQQCIITSVDPFSAKLANQNILAVAVIQRLGSSPFLLASYDTNVNRTIEHTFHTYEEVKRWFMNGVKADDREFDRVNQEAASNPRRNRRKS